MNQGAITVVAIIIAVIISTIWDVRKRRKQINAQGNLLCEGCGQKLKKNENFCPKCGKSKSEMAKDTKIEVADTAKPVQEAPKKKHKGLLIFLGIVGVYSIITLIGVALTPEKPLSWQKYNSTDGKYSLEFPCTPTSKNTPLTLDEVAGAKRVVTATQKMVQCTIDSYKEFDMLAIEYPSEVELTDQRTAIKNGLNGMTTSGKRTIQSSQETTFQGHPATDFVVKDNDNYIFKGKLILVGNTLYSVMTVDKISANENSDKFINSLIIN